MRYWLVFILLFIYQISSTNGQSLTNCDSWLRFNNPSISGIQIGNISITGHQLTIEAEINPSLQYSLYSTGDIVSKHAYPSDCNYLLRPDRGQLTVATQGGGYVHYETPPICSTKKDSTYHVAMTYDGKELVFYRNGVRMSHIDASGDLIQNNWTTTLGAIATHNAPAESFVGYINEVRIWNVTRTPEQIKTNVNQSLTSPETQVGLVAYYKFNTLKNVQGNSNYDGSILENITFPATVPSCAFASNGCPSNDCTLTASLKTTPNICNPLKFTFQKSTEDAISYTWSEGVNGTIFSTTENAEKTFSNAGSYPVTLIVKDSKGCVASTTQTVIATNLPDLIVTEPTAICKGNTITLQSGVTDAGTQYSWTPSTTLSDPSIYNPIATVDTTTMFELNIKNVNGCERKDSVKIDVISASAFRVSPADTIVCRDQSIALHAFGGDNYIWKTVDGIVIGTNANLEVNSKDISQYSVDIFSEKCQEKTSLKAIVSVFPLPDIIVSKSGIISCSNPSTTITVRGVNDVKWDAAESLVANGNQAIVTPFQTTTYTFVAMDKYSCKYPQNITIPVSFDASHTSIRIPSAFTPNGDGKNDRFKIVSNINFSAFDLKIFNRFGEMVFETKDFNTGWNGKYKGHDQPFGTYIFEVMGTNNICGEYHKRGTVVLIR